MWVFIYLSQFFRMVSSTLPYQGSLQINASRFFLIATSNAKQKMLCILKYFNSLLIVLFIVISLNNKIRRLHWQNLGYILAVGLFADFKKKKSSNWFKSLYYHKRNISIRSIKARVYVCYIFMHCVMYVYSIYPNFLFYTCFSCFTTVEPLRSNGLTTSLILLLYTVKL